MQIFRGLLVLAWLAVVLVSAHAIQAMGAQTAGDVFVSDFSHPWRAQFNTDFSFHLLLMASWIAFREKTLIRGLPFGALAILLGGAFSFAYIVVATFRAKGDMRRIMLGERYQTPA
ncbi:MAG: hypothetical protein ABW199_12360 [Caulobacterales bacterium]